jgi:HAD superfamily hydrolase (TIGR01450 family)
VTRQFLRGSVEPLAGRYDVALLDLDGVVYRGTEAVPGVAAALEKASQMGMRRAFVTNNAARSPGAVAELLRRLGIPAEPGDVITSAQTGAHVLAERLPPGARVLVVGTASLAEEVTARGLIPASSAAENPAAVIQGHSPDTGWRLLAEAVVAIRQGALWLATNDDLTVPSPRGPLPGNGSFVAVVRAAAEAVPLVTGKPEPAMHREMMERTGARHPLVVGDRLDTDIEGATRAGAASLLVLTGVTTPALLLAAPPEHRPSYLAASVGGLLTPHPEPAALGGTRWGCGGFVATAEPDGLHLYGSGDDEVDALRALCRCAWAVAPDRWAPRPVPVPRTATGPAVVAESARAVEATQRLGLAGTPVRP